MSAPISTYYQGWGVYNGLLERALTGLDAEQLSLRAAPGLWSIRRLANHIVAARAWWFHDWMGEGGETLAELVNYDDEEGADEREGAAVVQALGHSWSRVAESLARWTDADLDEPFQRPTPNASGERPWRTRQYIAWHVAEHDVHHGGEISLTLGMHGLRGLDL
jgi:uncharacterized damage-inducible protein DinB